MPHCEDADEINQPCLFHLFSCSTVHKNNSVNTVRTSLCSSPQHRGVQTFIFDGGWMTPVEYTILFTQESNILVHFVWFNVDMN